VLSKAKLHEAILMAALQMPSSLEAELPIGRALHRPSSPEAELFRGRAPPKPSS